MPALGRRFSMAGSRPRLSAGQCAAVSAIMSRNRAEDWEEVDCLCGERAGTVLTQIDRHGLPYRKLLCMRCGLLRVSPRWTQSRYAYFYEHEYRDLYMPDMTPVRTRIDQLAKGPNARAIASFVEKSWRQYGAGSNPRIVEIGAGGGWNLANLPREWERVGYDGDEQYLREGRALFGIDLRRGFLSQALAHLKDADIVLLSHVLEHVADPVASLRSIGDAVAPSALLMVEVPGIFRIHKTARDPMRYWQNAHTFTFCATTARDTMRRAGLEPLAICEWSRAVLKPANTTHLRPEPNADVAVAILRYLRLCETQYRSGQAVGDVPIVGPHLKNAAITAADAAIRCADWLGLIRPKEAPANA